MKARKSTKRPKPSKRKVPLRSTGKAQFITPAEARRRAARHVLNRMFQGARVRDGKTARWDVYDPTGKLMGKDVWVVYLNPEQPTMELRASKIIVVCKRTGRVLYEGSAHDEG